MSNEQIVNELKERRLPTFGTGVERRDRLKKQMGKLRRAFLSRQGSLLQAALNPQKALLSSQKKPLVSRASNDSRSSEKNAGRKRKTCANRRPNASKPTKPRALTATSTSNNSSRLTDRTN